MSSTWYTLKVTAEQAQAISQACELAARVGMSQLDMVADALPNVDAKLLEVRELIERTEQVVKPLIGLQGGGYYGIRNKQVPMSAKRAWDVHAVIRHRLSWDRAIRDGIIEEGQPRNWQRMMGVNFDDPDNVACEPLPTCTAA